MKHSIFIFMLFPLLLTINTFCMEQEEGVKQSEEIRKEEAAEFARQQEKAKKEAEREKKKRTKEEEPEVEPGKGKEEEEESVTPAASTQAEQAKPFSEIWKKNISTYRNRLQQESKKRETVMAKPPASLITFLEDNKDKLGEDNVDEALLEQVISWINNNQINVNERDSEKQPPTLLEFAIKQGFNSRIVHALLRNPKTSDVEHSIAINWYIWGMSSNARDILSAQLLFTSFALGALLDIYVSRTTLGMWGNRTFKQALTNAGLLGNRIDLVAKELRSSSMQDKYIEYLTATKNLDLIKIILFLGSFTWRVTARMTQRFKEQNETLTGNETTPDETTALMFAVGEGLLEIVRELLDRGANPFLANRYGDDAFSVVEIQLQRTTQDLKLHQVYQQIKQLLEPHAQQRAKDIARAIFFLLLARVVKNPGGISIVHGLPFDLAIPMAIGDLSMHAQQLILSYLERLTPQELAEIRAEVQSEGPVSTPALLERLSHYLPWAITAISYYLSSNP